MAVIEQTPRNVSTAAAGTVLFPYNFKILDKSHLVVTVNNEVKVVDVDFTVSGVGGSGGGNIVFVTPMIGGETVMRRRQMPYVRDTDYQNLGDLRTPTLNNDQDAPILMLQQLAELQERSLRLPDASPTAVDATMPMPEPLALIGWNADGTAIENFSPETFGLELAAGAKYQAAALAGASAVTMHVPETFGVQALFYNGIYQEPSTYSKVGDKFLFSEAFPDDGTVSVVAAAVRLGDTPDGSAVSYTPAGVGAISRTVSARMDDTLSAASYGTLQQAITAAAGRRLLVPDGTYALTEGLVIESPVEIVMAPGAVLDMSGMGAGAQLAEKVAIRIAGSEEAAIAITANVALGATVVQVASVAGLAVGDWVRVESDELYQDNVTVGSGRRGFITRIRAVDAGASTVTLEIASLHAFTASEDARLTKLNMLKGVVIRGGRIVGAGYGMTHNGIYAHHALAPLIEGVTIEGCEDTGVEIEYCVGAVVSACSVVDATSPDASPGDGSDGVRGYGVVDGSSMGSFIVGNTFARCRHAVAGGGSVSPFGATVVGNSSYGSLSSAYDCHEQCTDYRFINNKAYGGAQGFVIRGSGTLLDGNVIRNVASAGIQIKNFDTSTGQGITDVRVVGNLIDGAVSTGIQVYGDSAPARRVTIEGNTIRNVALTSSTSGVAVIGVVEDLAIRNNRIERVMTASGSDGSGIRIVGASGTPTLRVALDGNTIASVAKHGIDLQYVTDVRMSGNRIAAGAGHALYLRTVSDIAVAGAYLDHSGASSLHAVFADTVTRLNLVGCSALGNVAQTSYDGYRFSGCTGVLVSACVARNSGRRGIYSTTSDRVVVVNSDMRDAVFATKIEITGATTSINDNNIT